MIPQCRIRGQIRVGNLEVLHSKTNAIALRRQVGMIFQKPNPFPLSIGKNLELPLQEHGIRERHQIKDVGLWDEVKDRLQASALALSAIANQVALFWVQEGVGKLTNPVLSLSENNNLIQI
ncbi:hypothetical protein, partial [Fischerella thermalis]